MIIDSFSVFIIKSFFLGIMFFVATWILIPKSFFYYSQWKKTGKSNFLSAASICIALAGLFLAADLGMFVSAFIRRM